MRTRSLSALSASSTSVCLAATLAVVVAACGDSGSGGGPSDAGADAAGTGRFDAASDAGATQDGSSAFDTGAPPVDAAVDASAALAQRLLALTSQCTVASLSQYSIHQGSSPSIDVCKLNGAFFWNSSMNVDCDGQTTNECSSTTDPAYQNDTSFHQASDGKPLIASVLPYVVIPLPPSSSQVRWDYKAAGVLPGALVIVLYGGQLNYGVFGDEGPDNLIGEASYAMAKSLGVNPDPASGGVDSGATYIVLTGTSAVVSPIEDHQAAVTLGQKLAADLLQKN